MLTPQYWLSASSSWDDVKTTGTNTYRACTFESGELRTSKYTRCIQSEPER